MDVGTLDHYEHIHFGQSAQISPNLPTMTTVGNLDLYQAHFIYDGLSYQGIAGADNESYYAYQVGRVLFVHLNSMDTYAAQQQWLMKVMAAVDQDDSVDWVISLIHHPYQAEQYVGDISQTLRDSWMAILTGSPKHVLNIGGHHHLYARGQTRKWPTYHMISGGTAWDQYWGQSTEVDFDDGQKTISNWAWQIIDIDVENREMTVDSYAEAHPIIYANNGQNMHYNGRLIDSFHRKLDSSAPDQPEILNTITAPVTLPYTFKSSAFSTSGNEKLNSTQFQIAPDAGFANLKKDILRDYEDIYGDTGAPDYEPVDVNKDVDILKCTIAQYGLANGSYYLRVRHRDRNTIWSDWSDPVAFTIEGSNNGDPELSIDQSRYQSGDDVVVTYDNGYGNAKDWIGIYEQGQTPSSTESTQSSYVSGQAGSATFSGLADGQYFAGFFQEKKLYPGSN